jgi:hypothetical protein
METGMRDQHSGESFDRGRHPAPSPDFRMSINGLQITMNENGIVSIIMVFAHAIPSKFLK